MVDLRGDIPGKYIQYIVHNRLHVRLNPHRLVGNRHVLVFFKRFRSFNRAPLQSTAFNSAPLQSTAFNSAPLQSTSFNSAPLQSTAFNSAPLQSTAFNSAPLQSTVFNSAPLQSKAFLPKKLLFGTYCIVYTDLKWVVKMIN